MTTPIRGALVTGSPLHAQVEDGLQGVGREHLGLIEEAVRRDFADSLELDEALRPGREQENRWDYLLGHGASGEIIALEPHSAKNDEITTVIRKRRAALDQLRDHLKRGKAIARWFWVASGRVDFTPLDKAHLRLAQHGIEFVGRALATRHLAGLSKTTDSKGGGGGDEVRGRSRGRRRGTRP